MKKRISKKVAVDFSNGQAGILFDYNMPMLTTREKMLVMEKLLAKKSVVKSQLLASISTLDLVKALIKRELVVAKSVNDSRNTFLILITESMPNGKIADVCSKRWGELIANNERR